MKTILLLVGYWVAGFCQWFLASARTWYIAKDKPKTVAVIVFWEEIVLVCVTAYVILNPKQWWLLLSGAFGGAIGSYVYMRLKDFKRKRKNKSIDSGKWNLNKEARHG